MASFVPGFRGGGRQQTVFANAEAYERFMGRWSRLVAPRFMGFAALPEQGRILDAGSGTGSLAFAIAERNRRAQVVGIDLSKQYTAYAIGRNAFPGRITFEVGDAQHLRFPVANFDATVSLLVFNFIPDPKKALLELRRVTRPGGSVSAAVWDYAGAMRMLRVFWDAAASIDPDAASLDEKHMPLCRAGELSALWNRSDLERVHEQSIDISMTFKSFADYWEPFLLGQGPAGAYARSLSRGKLQALRTEIKRRLSLSAEDTPFVLGARVWAVRGIVPGGR